MSQTPTRSGSGLALLLLPLLAASCSMKELVADNMTGLLGEVEASFLDEPSYRYGREAGASLLKMLDGVIASSPHNEDLLAMGARMNAQFALGFAEWEDEAWARSLYAHALDYGLRAFDDEELTEAVGRNAEAVREVLRNYDEDDVPLIFWTGLALGGWINLNKDSVRSVANLPIAVAFMERVLELDEGYFHGGAWLFMGQYHGSRGVELGGDPEAARQALERATELSGGRLLLAKVYMARFYAIPTQNRALFEQLLEEVLEAPEDILPGERLATAIARHQAEELLFTIDDYFLEG